MLVSALLWFQVPRCHWGFPLFFEEAELRAGERALGHGRGAFAGPVEAFEESVLRFAVDVKTWKAMPEFGGWKGGKHPIRR